MDAHVEETKAQAPRVAGTFDLTGQIHAIGLERDLSTRALEILSRNPYTP